MKTTCEGCIHFKPSMLGKYFHRCGHEDTKMFTRSERKFSWYQCGPKRRLYEKHEDEWPSKIEAERWK